MYGRYPPTDGSPVHQDLADAVKRLPDQKVSAVTLYDLLDYDDEKVSEAVQDFIILGELELCQVRGTGARVWVKRRAPPDEDLERRAPRDDDEMKPRQGVWQAYVAENTRDRIAMRLFTSKDGALAHLAESKVVSPREFSPVSYLEDVWIAETSDSEGYDRMTAVVRREAVYERSQHERAR